MSTVELKPKGIESIKVIRESGHLRVQVHFRALGEGNAESIAMDIVLPLGDRPISKLENEAITRARWLLGGFLSWKDQEQEKSVGPPAEETASLNAPDEG